MDSAAESRPVVDALLDEYELTVDAVTPVRFTNNAVFRLRGAFVSTVEVSGERQHGSVVTWLAGDVRRPGSGAGPRTLHRIGQALGSIHDFSETFAVPDGFEVPTLDLSTVLAEVDPDRLGTAARWGIFDEVLRRAEVAFDGLVRSPATFGVLHNDFILLNCLHHGRRTAVIDFDDCGWGFYLQDLGGMLSNLKDYPDYRSLRRWFLDGYRSVRPLPSEDEQDLELMIALRHCASTLWLLNRHQASAIAEDQFQRILNYRINEIQSSLEAFATDTHAPGRRKRSSATHHL